MKKIVIQKDWEHNYIYEESYKELWKKSCPENRLHKT